MSPTRLQRGDALVQRIAGLTRKIAIGDSLRAVQHEASLLGLRPKPRPRGFFVKSPLGNPEKQRLTFSVWSFIVCYQGIKNNRTCR